MHGDIWGIWTQYFLEARNSAAIFFDGSIMANLLAPSICLKLSGGYDWDSSKRHVRVVEYVEAWCWTIENAKLNMKWEKLDIEK